jgi:hypothetical protein
MDSSIFRDILVMPVCCDQQCGTCRKQRRIHGSPYGLPALPGDGVVG